MHRMLRIAAFAAPTAFVAATTFQPTRTLFAQASTETSHDQSITQSPHPSISQKPLAGGCPMAQRPGATSPHNQSSMPVGHPPIPSTATFHHPHQSPDQPPHHHSANPLKQEGGCPMAKHRAEPKSDEKPRLAERTINPAYVAPVDDRSDEAALPAEGELTPEGEIPAAGRGNSDDGRHWVNPSANSLYRALKRKEKGIESEDAMSVSMVHNAVTANTWTCIMEYESTLHPDCKNPTLARFYGMDGIYTIKARFFNKLFGAPLPFDRHDWVVDRCGTEVRYIIDYYAFEELNHEGELEVNYSIDARPAPTVRGSVDRLRMAFYKYRQGEQFW